MDLTNLSVLKSLLSRFHIRPADKFGQNFLVSQTALEKIIASAEIQPGDVVLEIGAGLGTLTVALARSAGRVLAIEKDRRMVPALRFVLKKHPNTEILNEDFLKINILNLLATFDPSPAAFKVVANIPYYLTGKILELLLALSRKPELIILLVQKEVGERVCAAPGQMSLLAVSVQFYGRPELVGGVVSQSFFPPPAVDSVILKITPYPAPALQVDEKLFFRLVKMGFASRRKTLENNLAAGLRVKKTAAAKLIAQAGLAANARAQELSLENWNRLYNEVYKTP